MISRRGFLRAGAVLLAAPAIVRVGSLMPVRSVEEEGVWFAWIEPDPLYWSGVAREYGVFLGPVWHP